MLKTAELFELTDADLLDLIGSKVVIRLSLRDRAPEESEDESPFKSVTAVGTLVELQFSAASGAAIGFLKTGGKEPDEVRWDSDEYRAEFVWNRSASDES